MNKINPMKNMVILKNLPSNIIEEAFVILKPNKKIKPIKPVESNLNREEDYIVKEAENVISNYITNVENETKIKSNHIKKLESKYNRLKKLTITFGIIISIIAFFKMLGL